MGSEKESGVRMNIESRVISRLQELKVDFKPQYFNSYEDFESAIEFLQKQELKGNVEIIDIKKEHMSGLRRINIVMVRVTERGRDWLSTYNV